MHDAMLGFLNTKIKFSEKLVVVFQFYDAGKNPIIMYFIRILGKIVKEYVRNVFKLIGCPILAEVNT
jgi:hypothetical protein